MDTQDTSWHSYPKVYALGHRAVNELLLDDVIVEEKIDGSQFSFGRFGGELRIRSRGAVMVSDAPEQMFGAAVDSIRDLDLRDGWTYRGEYLQKPKHNTLAYERVPARHTILFDINTGEERYLTPDEKRGEAERLGMETVPLLFAGHIGSPQDIGAFLERTSVLGGTKIEGVVVKNYGRFGADKKVLMGKYVSESFKEVHGGEWKKNNPTSGDVIDMLIVRFKTDARWEKAVQHLKERGEYTQSPKDIGALIKEVQNDVAEECTEEIRDALFAHAIGHIRRGIVGGLPEWYKQKLLDEQFKV